MDENVYETSAATIPIFRFPWYYFFIVICGIGKLPRLLPMFGDAEIYRIEILLLLLS